MYFRLYFLLLKTLLEECKVQFQRDLECFFGLKLSLIENSAGGV